MKKYTYEAKNFEDAKSQAMAALMETEENLYIREIESINKLFNKKSVIEVIKKEDVIEHIKDLIKGIVSDMGLNVNMEVKKRDEALNITLYADNNAILIGKDARTLNALNTIIRQSIHNNIGENYKFILDVGEYKQKREWNIERMAKQIAREVAKTGVDAKLDPMNSYERRIVHNILGNNKKVYTESEGEEPNRYVVIKLKEELRNKNKEEEKVEE